MARTKKLAASKVKTQKSSARKSMLKTKKGMPVKAVKTKVKAKTKTKAPVKSAAAKVQAASVSSLKTLVTQMEKAPVQAIAGAKQLLKHPGNQAQQLIASYKKQAKNIAKQWSLAQKKLGAAEARLAQRANAASKSAVKAAQKAYADIVKKAERINKEHDIAHTVLHQVKHLGAKFDYLAKEVAKAASAWVAPEAKPVKEIVVTAKPAAKQSAEKKSATKKPGKSVVTAKTPPQKTAMAEIKPSVAPMTQTPKAQPVVQPKSNVNPPMATPITPHNIAQKPLTGGVMQPKPDAMPKSFNLKDDF